MIAEDENLLMPIKKPMTLRNGKLRQMALGATGFGYKKKVFRDFQEQKPEGVRVSNFTLGGSITTRRFKGCKSSWTTVDVRS